MESQPLFKPWVPEWMIKVVIGLMVFSLLCLFGLFTSNVAAAAGYYGIEPLDVQYSTIVYYAALASFYSLEQRFFRYLPAKRYFLFNLLLLILTCYITYKSRTAAVFFAMRFLQGIFSGGLNSICITLIFSRLSGERSREIGYSVFYGMLVCSTPLVMLIASYIYDFASYQALSKAMIFLILPGSILLMSILKDVRLARKFPLHQLDLSSFVLYATMLILLGYVLIYGQRNYWLENTEVWLCLAALAVLLPLFILRQRGLKRPFLNLKVFNYANFRAGALLLVPFYVFRGALNVTSNYFDAVLGMDPIHVSILMAVNVVGVVISVFISSRLILQKASMRMIWLTGFGFLLLFHGWMYHIFASQADTSSFIMPLIFQGLGAGTLMTPIVLFTVSSVPTAMSSSASMAGILFRFVGFSVSMALISYFQLFTKSVHQDEFRDHIVLSNPMYHERMLGYEHVVQKYGVPVDRAGKLAQGILKKAVDKQLTMLYAMDYYALICWGIVAVMLIIALYPYFTQTVLNVKSRQPAPYL